MSYYQNARYSGGGRTYSGYSDQRSDWRNRPQYGNSNGGNSGGQRQGKKRTGCSSGMAKGNSDAPYVRGWNASRSKGLTSIICGPYKNTAKHSSKSGKVWENWCAKVQIDRNQPYLTSCLYDVQTGRVIIDALGFVLNPKTNYCGTFKRK